MKNIVFYTILLLMSCKAKNAQTPASNYENTLKEDKNKTGTADKELNSPDERNQSQQTATKTSVNKQSANQAEKGNHNNELQDPKRGQSKQDNSNVNSTTGNGVGNQPRGSNTPTGVPSSIDKPTSYPGTKSSLNDTALESNNSNANHSNGIIKSISAGSHSQHINHSGNYATQKGSLEDTAAENRQGKININPNNNSVNTTPFRLNKKATTIKERQLIQNKNLQN